MNAKRVTRAIYAVLLMLADNFDWTLVDRESRDSRLSHYWLYSRDSDSAVRLLEK